MTKKRGKKARLLTMDELRARPCKVGGRPALFHRWVEEDDAILKVPMFWDGPRVDTLTHHFKHDKVVPNVCDIVVTHHTFALVEYRNGTIAKVAPELIQFDGKEGSE